jgi:class 3 adenylate cyclase/TolB-like protein
MAVIRKLVAVVAADVVGYSRLMERDEAGTHERLRKLRDELIDPKIAEHSGRIVHTSGDGMLLEFPSATSALRCAVEVQRELGARNLYAAADEKIELRIGINLGDIIVEGDDILGDGVNVAARLETLAEPGGISVASAVWEQVHEDLGVEFVDSGEQHVKNISEPIRVYRVALGKGVRHGVEAAAAAPASAGKRLHQSPAIIAAAAVAVLALLGSGLWYYTQRAGAPPPAVTTAAGPSPRSLMIVPLTAPSGDSALGSFADTLTADITRALADSMRDVQIVAPSAAAAHKGQSGDQRAIARDANVRYLVEGDVVPAGEDIAVTMRLVDGATAKQLGSERRTIARSRLAQDQQLLLSRLIFASRDLFENAERRRVASESAPPASAQDLVARADWLSSRDDLALQREARKLYDEALRRDPSLVAALVGRALTFDTELALDFTAERQPLVAAMDRDTVRALSLDDRDPMAWFARSVALSRQWRYDAAFDANDRARSLDPTRFFYQRVYLFILTGRSREALQVVDERASMIGRMDPEFRGVACHAHLHLGNYERAIGECERAATSDERYLIWMDLTAAYAQTGDMTKAAAAKAELLRRVPDFSISRFERKRFSNNATWEQEIRTYLIPGLRKAGVPE